MRISTMLLPLVWFIVVCGLEMVAVPVSAQTNDAKSLMHHAVVDYEGRGGRYLHRATVIAEPPI